LRVLPSCRADTQVMCWRTADTVVTPRCAYGGGGGASDQKRSGCACRGCAVSRSVPTRPFPQSTREGSGIRARGGGRARPRRGFAATIGDRSRSSSLAAGTLNDRSDAGAREDTAGAPPSMRSAAAVCRRGRASWRLLSPYAEPHTGSAHCSRAGKWREEIRGCATIARDAEVGLSTTISAKLKCSADVPRSI